MRAELPFLRSGCRPGQHPRTDRDHREVAVSEGKRQKNSYSTERKFPTSEPEILYFGTPVALLSSLNEDGATDVAPISSFLRAGMDFAPRIAHRDENRRQRGAAPGQQTSDAHRHDDVAVAIRLIGKRAHLPRALFVF